MRCSPLRAPESDNALRTVFIEPHCARAPYCPPARPPAAARPSTAYHSSERLAAQYPPAKRPPARTAYLLTHSPIRFSSLRSSSLLFAALSAAIGERLNRIIPSSNECLCLFTGPLIIRRSSRFLYKYARGSTCAVQSSQVKSSDQIKSNFGRLSQHTVPYMSCTVYTTVLDSCNTSPLQLSIIEKRAAH